MFIGGFIVPRKTQNKWLTAAAAARILAVEPVHVAGLAADGLIVARTLPGVLARYERVSCERLAAAPCGGTDDAGTIGPDALGG